MNPPKKPRNHLFSPHTDQCIYCGKSAADDAIENTPCGCDEPLPCEACKGLGWFFFNTGDKRSPRYEIQRCDVCERFTGDLAALEAVEQTCRSHAALLEFVEKVSRLQHSTEPPEPDDPFEHTSEDYIVTLNQVIMDARQLLGTADKCSHCGQIVPCVIGCPDGAELCQACFDAGRH